MIRKLNLLLFVLAGLGFVGVYVLKFSIEHTAAERVALIRQIDEQQETLSLLRADWSYLTQPGHIAPIITRHQEVLEIAQVDPRQFGRFDDLPMRPARPAPPDVQALDALFEMIDAGIDPIGALIEEID
jgi:hypothetical protein